MLGVPVFFILYCAILREPSFKEAVAANFQRSVNNSQFKQKSIALQYMALFLKKSRKVIDT